MRVRILPYRTGSRSVRALAAELGVRRLNLIRIKFRPRPGDVIINWGAHVTPWPRPLPEGVRWLNDPQIVAHARNKLLAFQTMAAAGVPTVPFTTDRAEALRWCDERSPEWHVVGMARTTLTGQGGAGIRVLHSGQEYGIEGDPWPEAPLYTKFVRAKHEFRFHVIRDPANSGFRVFDVQKKRRRDGVLPHPVRNLETGYVFCRQNLNFSGLVESAACHAVSALGLDFGAVDLLMKEDGTPYVLEVNTAPGLEGTTLTSYATAIGEYLNVTNPSA